MTISRKAAILLTAYITAGALALGGFLEQEKAVSRRLRIAEDNSESRAFASLSESLNDMDDALYKALCASSPGITASSLTEAYARASAAEACLAALPRSDIRLEHTASFISKTCDYVFFLSKKAASGGTLSDEEYENLRSLFSSAESVAGTVGTLYERLLTGSVSLRELEQLEDDVEKAEDDVSDMTLSGSFKKLETEFPELPSLIYDGPFSEHIEKLEPLYLKDRKLVSRADAVRVASLFTGIDRNRLSILLERNEEFPVYLISDGRGVSVEVTKAGGVVSYMSDERTVFSAGLTVEEGIRRAKAHLKSMGLSRMRETYHITEDNEVTVNFAAEEDSVILYPDLVKVTVALDNGGMTHFEAAGYIMSHRERALPAPAVTEEQAAAAVSSRLTVLSHAVALIPTSGKNEVLCHEFKCESPDGRHVIVYVNAETGAEEKLLILLETENGTLTK